jgi:hypothetical protein
VDREFDNKAVQQEDEEECEDEKEQEEHDDTTDSGIIFAVTKVTFSFLLGLRLESN